MLGRHFPAESREEQQLKMAKPSNSSEHELSSSVIILTFIIIGTESFVGIIVNSFIMAINVTVWVQKKAISTSGQILLFLSASRIALQSFMVLDIISVCTFPDSYFKCVFNYTFRVCFMFLNCCGLWFAAVLSFYYFVKISNFSCPLLLKLKWRISGLIPWFLWLSVLISFSISMSFPKIVCTVSYNSSFTFHYSNYTKTGMVTLAIFFNLGIFIPLAIFIVTATLLIISLKRHTLQMKNSATGYRDPSTVAHVEAIKAISYFLILYIFNAVALFLLLSSVFPHGFLWTVSLKIIIAAYPAGHSILLIQDNPGLRRAWSSFNLKFIFVQKSRL
ncbi:PREDICTED: LOW QUALITY PROTEIN: taste receptor type 2 member 39-like [Chinchilla lanigera]|uniref:LOW QUALITY PROTEIN: taste receptor type 2 member 39-like n=1 Tax=Chinchilla lanigera TaxID=34839 RepID=UPI0006977C61|nr:PREDICTED: LOW QUALITY PROTEIN: taste receptor type 2 member 39-like [Chinchilla lanigera]